MYDFLFHAINNCSIYFVHIKINQILIFHYMYYLFINDYRIYLWCFFSEIILIFSDNLKFCII
jgi:hypothetical protein